MGIFDFFNNKKNAQSRKEDRKKALQEAVEGCNFGEIPTVKDVAEYLGISERTVRDRIKEHGGYTIQDGEVVKKPEQKVTEQQTICADGIPVRQMGRVVLMLHKQFQTRHITEQKGPAITSAAL